MTQEDPSQRDNGQSRQHWARRIITEKKYHILVSLMLLAVFLAGAWYGTRKGGQAGNAGSRRILYYVDPMNPAHTSPEPGLSPCGMKMEPIYADSEGGEMPPPFLLPGSVRITPQKQQLIGVSVGVVEKAPFTHTLRTLGRVAVDETRVYRLSSYVDGWIQNTYKNSTGSLVMKDEVLVSYYSRDTLNEVQLYLVALNQLDRIQRGDREKRAGFSVESQRRLRETENALKNLGMGKIQIQELAQTRRSTQDIYLVAPVTSFVLTRNVSPGQKISKGDELYKLADLSRVWIVADLFENEAPLVKPGIKVRATLPHRRQAIWATVTDILPDFDKASRTLKVRLETDNPDYALRPDIFVDVEFPVDLPEAVTVPVDAVMNSGLKKTVFVERGNGYFEPRKVEIGWRWGDRVEITEGLEPGERIVISGNFLVDSESRMKLAAAGFVGEVARDPVSGVNVDESKSRSAGLQGRYHNRTYYFHSEETKRQFEQNPERYLEKQAKTQESGGAAGQGKPGPAMAKCPVCGLEVDETQAKARGLTGEYQGKTYYFCRYYCNREFDKAPGSYVKEESACCPHGGQGRKEDALIVKDPVCGLEVNREEAAARRLQREYLGQAYSFCRDYCARQFDKSPERYVPSMAPSHTPPPSPPATVQSAVPGVDRAVDPPGALPKTPAADQDPVCGMKVDTSERNPHMTNYRGNVFYFCNDRCKEQFDLDPEHYLTQGVTALTPPAPPMARPPTPAPPAMPKGQPAAAAHPAMPMAPPPAPAPPEAAKAQPPVPPQAAPAKPQPVAPGPPESPKSHQVPVSQDPDADNFDKKGADEPQHQVCSLCGMILKQDPKTPLKYKSTYQGKTYFFCSDWCKKEFDKNPKDYAIPGKAAPEPQKQVKPPSKPQKKTPKPKASKSPAAAPGAGE